MADTPSVFPTTDPGLAALERAHALLAPGDRWCAVGRREFTWWGQRLAQRVWAEPPRETAGRTSCRVHAVTDLLRDVAQEDRVLELVNTANRFASLSAVVWDRPRRLLSLRCAVQVDAANAAWLVPLFARAAALQASAAHVRVADMAELFEAPVDASQHPENGPRPDEGEALKTVWQMGLESVAPTPYGRAEVAAVRSLVKKGRVVFSDDLNLRVEFPEGDALAPRVFVAGDAEHLALGRGALVRLRLPSSAPPATTMLRAVELNVAEDVEATEVHHLGGWRCDTDDALVFATFLPSSVFAPGLLREVVGNTLRRLEWVRRRRLLGAAV